MQEAEPGFQEGIRGGSVMDQQSAAEKVLAAPPLSPASVRAQEQPGVQRAAEALRAPAAPEGVDGVPRLGPRGPGGGEGVLATAERNRSARWGARARPAQAAGGAPWRCARGEEHGAGAGCGPSEARPRPAVARPGQSSRGRAAAAHIQPAARGGLQHPRGWHSSKEPALCVIQQSIAVFPNGRLL